MPTRNGRPKVGEFIRWPDGTTREVLQRSDRGTAYCNVKVLWPGNPGGVKWIHQWEDHVAQRRGLEKLEVVMCPTPECKNPATVRHEDDALTCVKHRVDPGARCHATHNPGVWPYLTRCTTIRMVHGPKHRDKDGREWEGEWTNED